MAGTRRRQPSHWAATPTANTAATAATTSLFTASAGAVVVWHPATVSVWPGRGGTGPVNDPPADDSRRRH